MASLALAKDVQRCIGVSSGPFWACTEPGGNITGLDVSLAGCATVTHHQMRAARDAVEGMEGPVQMHLNFARDRLECRAAGTSSDSSGAVTVPGTSAIVDAEDVDDRVACFATEVAESLLHVGMFGCVPMVQVDVESGRVVLNLTGLPGVRDTVLHVALERWRDAHYSYELRAKCLNISIPCSEIPSNRKRKRL